MSITSDQRRRLAALRDRLNEADDGLMLDIALRLMVSDEEETTCYEVGCEGYGGPCSCGEQEPLRVSRPALVRIASREPRPGDGAFAEVVSGWARARLALLELEERT